MPRKRPPELANQCHETITQLLHYGCKISYIAAFIQREYGISKATAHRDIQEVVRAIDESDDDHTDSVDFEDRDSLMRMAYQFAMQATMKSDLSSFSKASREYERLFRMGGLKNTLGH